MAYMTLQKVSEKWRVPVREINDYRAANRIPDAIKAAAIWLIPKDAEKLLDRRRKKCGDECDKNCNM